MPHPPKVKMIQSQSFQDIHLLPKWNPKSVLTRPPQPPYIKIIKIHHLSSIHNNYPISVLSRLSHPFKVEIVQYQSFHDHHTLPKEKLSKSNTSTSSSQMKVIPNQSFLTRIFSSVWCSSPLKRFLSDSHILWNSSSGSIYLWYCFLHSGIMCPCMWDSRWFGIISQYWQANVGHRCLFIHATW